MRRERWIATALVAAAVWIGVLGGCAKKQGGNEGASNAPAATESTSTAGADTAAGGGQVSLALGDQIVKERCVLCHGESGKGDGPGGAALNPKPRNWTDHTYMGTRTDDQLYDVIYNGKGAMPAWGKQGILKPNEIRSAIMKVRTFDPQYQPQPKG